MAHLSCHVNGLEHNKTQRYARLFKGGRRGKDNVCGEGYGCSVVRGEELVDVSLDDTGLPRPKVTDDQHLVQVLLFALCRLDKEREESGSCDRCFQD